MNFLIGGINVDTVLRAVRGFQASGDTTSVGPHFIGTLPSGIKCYVNPNYDADVFVIGYKGTNMMDAGLEYNTKKVA